MANDDKKGEKSEWGTGWKVFAALVVLSALEIAVTLMTANPLPFLTPLVLAKAALIIWYFMRLGNLADKEATE
ncbi:MAG TPA: hypothetical protein EYP41_22820 [Anaerolineae bacterium]|nr:hypothetical protein [Anaerolineae bacterium]HIP73935.1 hypothetical protein [Anaerolineae bacterium]